MHPSLWWMTGDELMAWLGFSMSLFAVYWLFRPILPALGCRRNPKGPDDEASSQRQHGWILSGVTGAVLSVVGAVQCAEMLRLFLKEGTEHSAWEAFFNEYPAYITYAIVFFMAHCVVDTVVGTIWYPKAMDMASGYIHHAVYLYVCLYALRVCPRIFALFFIEEFPTLLLALGNWHHGLRNDNLFGGVFFVLRIVSHICMLLLTGWSRIELKIGLTLMTLTLGMHVMWMRTWCLKYGLCKRRPKAS